MRSTLKNIEGIEVIYVNESIDKKESDNNSILLFTELNTNKNVELVIAKDCQYFIGGEYYFHQGTLDDLITPGEPLEAGMLTLIIIDNKVQYIFTGKVY